VRKGVFLCNCVAVIQARGGLRGLIERSNVPHKTPDTSRLVHVPFACAICICCRTALKTSTLDGRRDEMCSSHRLSAGSTLAQTRHKEDHPRPSSTPQVFVSECGKLRSGPQANAGMVSSDGCIRLHPRPLCEHQRLFTRVEIAMQLESAKS
jgi:hypothetical protein